MSQNYDIILYCVFKNHNVKNKENSQLPIFQDKMKTKAYIINVRHPQSIEKTYINFFYFYFLNKDYTVTIGDNYLLEIIDTFFKHSFVGRRVSKL